jgi:hypothetical protein
MHKSIIVLPVVALLAGCATAPTGPVGPLGPAVAPVTAPAPAVTAPSVISQIQADVVLACGFEPEAATIATLINAGIGAIGGAIAQAICGAVKAAPALGLRGARHGAHVYGVVRTPAGAAVPVRGRFVR